MLICPNCKKQFNTADTFCDVCGTRLAEMQPANGNQYQPQQPAPQYQQPAPQYQQPAPQYQQPAPQYQQPAPQYQQPAPQYQQPAPQYQQPAPQYQQAPYGAPNGAPKGPNPFIAFFTNLWSKIIALPKKWLIAGAGGIAAILILLIVLIIALCSKAPNYGLYVKDGELMYSKLSGKSFEVSSDFMNADFSESDVKVNKDVSIIFYPDKTSSGSGYNLYFRSLKKTKAEAVKISNNVTRYKINEDGSYAFFMKDGDLYEYNVKKESSEKISSKVSSFYISENGKTVVFTTYKEDGTTDLYYRKSGKDKEKIDGKIGNVSKITEDFDIVYYTKENDDEKTTTMDLYKCKLGKDSEKLISKISGIVRIYDDDLVYYYKSETKEAKLSDYIYDDMEESDSKISRPDYDDFDDYDEYEEAYEEYQQKLARDEIREELEDATFSNTVKTLYFFDGKESKEIADDFRGTKVTGSDDPVVVYTVSSSEKIKLSEIENYYNFENLLSGVGDVYVANEENTMKLEQDDAQDFELNEDADTLYFIDDLSEDGDYGTLYTVAIKKKKLGEKKTYDTDVYEFDLYDDEVVYFKDVDEDNDSGELYFNKKKVDHDVDVDNIRYVEKTDILVYTTDPTVDGYTLKVYDGKAKGVGNEIAYYAITSEGDILFLRDYSSFSGGDLYIYNGKAKKLDTDVTYIFDTYVEED